MDILVYGAGVIGCELAHMLYRGGGRVTLLARGSWRDTISRDGLVIRHYAQLRTTVDLPALVDRLEAEQVYDLVFVVMQAGQLPAVLPEVAANRSRFVVLVGNNPAVEQSLRLASEGSPVEKEIAFGFQATGGRREDGRVVSIHAGVGMTVGGPDGPLSEEFRRRLLQAFSGTGCRLTWEDRMDAWLKCHLALILPVCYVCYAVGGRLPEASPAQRRAILDAALEGCVMLRSLGVPIRTQDSEDYFRPGPKRRRWPQCCTSWQRPRWGGWPPATTPCAPWGRCGRWMRPLRICAAGPGPPCRSGTPCGPGCRIGIPFPGPPRLKGDKARASAPISQPPRASFSEPPAP